MFYQDEATSLEPCSERGGAHAARCRPVPDPGMLGRRPGSGPPAPARLGRGRFRARPPPFPLRIRRRPHSLHTPARRPGFPKPPSFAVRRCEHAKARSRARCPRAAGRLTSGRSKMRRLETAKGWLRRAGGACRRWGGVAALAALKQKPARSATNRTGGCTICGKPGGATNTCGTDSRGTPRLQRHMAIIPCARSANVQIMCQFALVKS